MPSLKPESDDRLAKFDKLRITDKNYGAVKNMHDNMLVGNLKGTKVNTFGSLIKLKVLYSNQRSYWTTWEGTIQKAFQM
jgi:hypothetical protein